MSIRKLALNGVEYDIGNVLNVSGAADYQGRELSEYTWAQLKEKATTNDVSDLMVGDYKTITCPDGEIFVMEIAGINTYTRTTDQELGYHIDWISKDLHNTKVVWNTSNDNNGNSTSPYPYLVSNVKNYLTTTLYDKLPQEVKDVIVDKRFLLEQRYSASGKITDSTSWGWENMGKLWLPSEYEVFGSVVWGTKGYSAMQAVQYPIFANSWKHRIKGLGNGGSRCNWWLSTVISGNSTHCCLVSNSGYASDTYASHTTIGVPVCFRT